LNFFFDKQVWIIHGCEPSRRQCGLIEVFPEAFEGNILSEEAEDNQNSLIYIQNLTTERDRKLKEG
jgi:hypothetical protein